MNNIKRIVLVNSEDNETVTYKFKNRIPTLEIEIFHIILIFDSLDIKSLIVCLMDNQKI
jgi:hypothetical protein